MGHDHIDPEGHQLRRETRETVELALGPAAQGFAFLVPELVEALSQRADQALVGWSRRTAEDADPVALAALLPLGSERHHERQERPRQEGDSRSLPESAPRGAGSRPPAHESS